MLTHIFAAFLALLLSRPATIVELAFATVGTQRPASDSGDLKTPVSLAGEARLIETKQDSEQAFQHDITARGLCAVILKLTNESKEATYSLQRSNITFQTEFDARSAALDPQRAYDRLMWKVGSGPAFAEAAIIRAAAEGARKKKLQKSVLAAAIGATVTLAPGEEIEGALFFEKPKDVKTLRFSTLVIGEIANQQTNERKPMRLQLTPINQEAK